MSVPEGPHCLSCQHRDACVLPQRETGVVCGWYNARMAGLVTKARQKHQLKALRAESTRPMANGQR
jgi:hypothetical protein